jgi:hypothetical protein
VDRELGKREAGDGMEQRHTRNLAGYGEWGDPRSENPS